ncbi:phage tail protein [Oenococcus oeni]|nr:phage tail protein [Oenococcus oeni]AWW98023.1 hypothetical protein C5H79_00010 [Oenococcus oeni]
MATFGIKQVQLALLGSDGQSLKDATTGLSATGFMQLEQAVLQRNS